MLLNHPVSSKIKRFTGTGGSTKRGKLEAASTIKRHSRTRLMGKQTHGRGSGVATLPSFWLVKTEKGNLRKGSLQGEDRLRGAGLIDAARNLKSFKRRLQGSMGKS